MFSKQRMDEAAEQLVLYDHYDAMLAFALPACGYSDLLATLKEPKARADGLGSQFWYSVGRCTLCNSCSLKKNSHTQCGPLRV
jgi:hypothetical protein